MESDQYASSGFPWDDIFSSVFDDCDAHQVRNYSSSYPSNSTLDLTNFSLNNQQELSYQEQDSYSCKNYSFIENETSSFQSQNFMNSYQTNENLNNNYQNSQYNQHNIQVIPAHFQGDLSDKKSTDEVDPHNAIEKRYRHSINSKIDELRSMLVGSGILTSKLNKSVVLKYAIDRIKQLEKENQHLSRQLSSYESCDSGIFSSNLSSYSSNTEESLNHQDFLADYQYESVPQPQQQQNIQNYSVNPINYHGPILQKASSSRKRKPDVEHKRYQKRIKSTSSPTNTNHPSNINDNFLINPNYQTNQSFQKESNQFLFCAFAAFLIFLNPVTNFFSSMEFCLTNNSFFNNNPYTPTNLMVELMNSISGDFCLKKWFQIISWTLIHIFDWGLAYLCVWLAFNPKTFCTVKYFFQKTYLHTKMHFLIFSLLVRIAFLTTPYDKMNPKLSNNSFLNRVSFYVEELMDTRPKNEAMKKICSYLHEMNFDKNFKEELIAEKGLAIVIVLVRKFNYLVISRLTLRSVVILLSDHPLAVYKQIDKKSFFRWFRQKTSLIDKDTSQKTLNNLEEDLMTHLLVEVLEFRRFNENIKASKLELVLFECKKIVSSNVFLRYSPFQSDTNLVYLTPVGIYFRMINILKRISLNKRCANVPFADAVISRETKFHQLLAKSLEILQVAESIILHKGVPQLSLIEHYSTEMSNIWLELKEMPLNDINCVILKNYFIQMNLEIEKKCVKIQNSHSKKPRGAYLLSLCTMNFFKVTLAEMTSQIEIYRPPNASNRSIRYETCIMSIKNSIKVLSNLTETFYSGKKDTRNSS